MNNEYEEGEISEEEKMLFLRKESESNCDEDSEGEWDDSQLIKEYDKAVAKAKEQVLKKLQAEMGLTNSDIKEVFGNTVSTKKNKKKASKTKAEPKWDVGGRCRAIYFEDGDEYEAEILELIEPDSCIVNFIGYDNQEEVFLSELKPSLGKRAIEMQVMAAIRDKAALQDMLSEKESHSCSDSQDRQKKGHKKIPLSGKGYRRPPNYHLSFPPPPPPLPMVEAGHSMDAEALSSMLMSWYMCGYYTGYYQRATKDS